MGRISVLLLLGLATAAAQDDPAYATLAKAYEALGLRDYDQAIAAFQRALEVAPDRVAVRKDLAYAYLKAGETEAARDQFAAALRLAPQDEHLALELAYLCYETRQPLQARRLFDGLRRQGNAAAEKAFEDVDRPLREGIARWSEAVRQSPDNLSAHEELATLAARRDEWELATRSLLAAWHLRPTRRSLLLDLGRAYLEWGQARDGQPEAPERLGQARAALLAASRGDDVRTTEAARELLPARYPYVDEFRQALALDADNAELRRELAFLLLQMGRQSEAEREFSLLLERAPGDLLSSAQLGLLRLARGEKAQAMPLLERVLRGEDAELADRIRTALGLPSRTAKPPSPTAPVRSLGERSYEAGHLEDAVRYLRQAHAEDPLDFPVILRLGWTHNLLHQDGEAARWFGLARQSPNPSIAEEAARAHKSLQSDQAPFRMTTWLFPLYSSRWQSLFGYGQSKLEFRLRGAPLRPYLSSRFVGDTRRSLGALPGAYLSESAVLLGVGLATQPWRGVTGWGEANTSVTYLGRGDVGRMVPDYRGGLSWGRGSGASLLGREPGLFQETHTDAVYVHRFNRSLLGYVQQKAGWTAPPWLSLHSQWFWGANATLDAKRQYWANFVETGPGVRLRTEAMPRSMWLMATLLRGAHLTNAGNPRRPNYWDLRIGVWYAVTR